jgi:hypothetical protein
MRRAEAEAESKALQGQGMANQRKAIVEGRSKGQGKGRHATIARTLFSSPTHPAPSPTSVSRFWSGSSRRTSRRSDRGGPGSLDVRGTNPRMIRWKPRLEARPTGKDNRDDRRSASGKSRRSKAIGP